MAADGRICGNQKMATYDDYAVFVFKAADGQICGNQKIATYADYAGYFASAVHRIRYVCWMTCVQQ